MALFPKLQAKVFQETHTQHLIHMLKSCAKMFRDRSFEKNEKGQKITYFWPVLDQFLATLQDSEA